MDRTATLGGRGYSAHVGERCEHPGSLDPAAVMGTPPPFTSPPPVLPLIGFFLCVNCAIFILFLLFSPFSQRNKGLEVVSPLALVISMEEGHHPRVITSALFSGEDLVTGPIIPLCPERILWGSPQECCWPVEQRVHEVLWLLSCSAVQFHRCWPSILGVKSRCLGTRLPGSKFWLLQLIDV